MAYPSAFFTCPASVRLSSARARSVLSSASSTASVLAGPEGSYIHD